MDTTGTRVRKFLYSHYFSGGLRQALGILLPPFILIGVYGLATVGVAAAFGALCVSTIDQPGPHQHRLLGMLASAVLGTLAALLTGLATPWPLVLITTAMGLTFFFGLFSALGRKASLVGFGCLLLMTLTMHGERSPEAAFWHAAAVLGGGLWYTAFSVMLGRVQGLKQEKQALAVTLFGLAEYIHTRSFFYDVTADLEETYRRLVPKQSALAESVQAARDLILRMLSSSSGAPGTDRERTRLGNIFVDMVDLQDTMLATYTDYTLLRETLADSDFLLFAGQALRQLARDLDRMGLALIEERLPQRSTHIKAQLRAMEYETVLMKQRGFPAEQPQVWIIVVQVLRRLRVASRLLARMETHVRMPATNSPELLLQVDKSLRRFVSREDISVKRLRTHLTMSSAHCRYAIRLSLAVGIGLTVGHAMAWIANYFGSNLGHQGNWIVLTILVIMKPGFALSWQRNRRRLAGTLIGCAVVAALLATTNAPFVLLSVMLVATVLSNSLVQVNYTASSIFNTIFVLLGFYFLSPGSLMLVGERAFDALLGSLIVLACSFILPSWESRSIANLARSAITANRLFLEAATNPSGSPATAPLPRDDLNWRLARRDAQTAFANFAEAYYRMMQEPKSHRIAVSHLNDLLVQTHMLTAQITTISPLMTVVGPAEQQPEKLRRLFGLLDDDLQEAEHLLATPAARTTDTAEQVSPVLRTTPEVLTAIGRALDDELQRRNQEIELDETGLPQFEVAHVTHQLRQIGRTIQRIVEDVRAVRVEAAAPARSTAARSGVALAQG